MFIYDKKLQYPVKIDKPNPRLASVIISQYGSSYGNYVVVSHGTGNTTLYAHLSKRSVKVGDAVAQGDVLGVTGSTGNSTGPHLHFEITEGGNRVDPLKYLTDYKKGWS
jgi:murein DD-endopeptidase MepM/ murein hydrolase activator NlpD